MFWYSSVLPHLWQLLGFQAETSMKPYRLTTAKRLSAGLNAYIFGISLSQPATHVYFAEPYEENCLNRKGISFTGTMVLICIPTLDRMEMLGEYILESKIRNILLNTTTSLPVIDPKDAFQPDFQPVIDEVLGFLTRGLTSNLHSVYVFGSVARKTARVGHSNLDIVVVTQRPLSDKEHTIVKTIKWRFSKQYNHLITGIQFQFGTMPEILSLDGIFTWGFMLRHCCVCVHGEDLSQSFGDFEPSWEIAKHWNMDVGDWVTLYRDKIAKSHSDTETRYLQKIIAKKLLRASYSLIMYKDKQWIENPVECGKHFLRFYPKKKVEVQRLVILLQGKPVPKRSIIGILDGFGKWLVKAYDKTEFRIG